MLCNVCVCVCACSVEFDPDEGLNEFQEDIYEHEIRLPFSAFGHHEAYWADVVCIHYILYSVWCATVL